MQGMKRNSNVELLRLVAMLLVVANHFATHGGISLGVTGTAVTGKLFFSQVLACCGKLGVDIFVIISSWFMYGKQLSWYRVRSLWLPAWFWGVAIFAALPLLSGHYGLNFFLVSFFPVVHNSYWFVTNILVLSMAAPFLSEALQGTSVRTHGLFSLGLVTAYSVIPTVLLMPGYAGRSYFGYSDMLWFLILFVGTAWLKRADVIRRLKPAVVATSVLIALASTLAYVYGCDWVMATGHKGWNWTLWRQMNSLPMLVVALGSFVLALRLPVFSNAIVNFLAAGSYGVYLISDNRLLVRTLWLKWVNVPSLYRADDYCGKAVISIAVVFLASLLLSSCYVAVSRVMRRICKC